MNAKTKFVQTYLSDTGIVLCKYRRVMDSIHRGGNIFYDKGRMDAYNMVARLASDLRRDETQKSKYA